MRNWDALRAEIAAAAAGMREPDALRAKLAAAPASGGIELDDPGDGVMTKREAQAIFVSAMAVVMEEWHGRGRVEGRLRERERIAGILRHQAALRRRDRALELALTTDMTIDEAVSVLEGEPREIEGNDP